MKNDKVNLKLKAEKPKPKLKSQNSIAKGDSKVLDLKL